MKFENVKKALEEQTKGSANWLTLTKNVDGRHSGKYALQNMITKNISGISFKTLDEVIKEFNLNL